jgi:hypothetical protein
MIEAQFMVLEKQTSLTWLTVCVTVAVLTVVTVLSAFTTVVVTRVLNVSVTVTVLLP